MHKIIWNQDQTLQAQQHNKAFEYIDLVVLMHISLLNNKIYFVQGLKNVLIICIVNSFTENGLKKL